MTVSDQNIKPPENNFIFYLIQTLFIFTYCSYQPFYYLGALEER